MIAAEFVIVAVIGLIFGSFATAVSWREVHGVSWVKGRSACPSCKTVLGVRDLIPLLSWILSKGRCRHCAAPVGVRYPLTEIAVAAGSVTACAVYGFTPQAFCIVAAMPVLAALFLIDMDMMILPDRLNGGLALAGLAFAVSGGTVPGGLVAAVVYAALAWGAGRGTAIILRKDALGPGDVKFFGAAGLWLGIYYLPIFLFLSGCCGVAWGLAQGRGRQKAFPFGPALILAFYICLILQGLQIKLY